VTNWSTSAYNFVFLAGTADTTGAAGQFGTLNLWGPGNGSNDGLPASSPAGGNFVRADGAFNVAPITQTIVGLVPGEAAVLTFYWAGARNSRASQALLPINGRSVSAVRPYTHRSLDFRATAFLGG